MPEAILDVTGGTDTTKTGDDDGLLDVGALCAWLRMYTHYDPITGAFTWAKRRPYAKVNLGDPVGSEDKLGYRVVSILGRRCGVHRLIWVLAHNSWPVGLVDHANGDPRDNSIGNLRVTDKSGNAANKKRHANNRANLKGVSFHKSTGLWQAQIMHAGKKKYLGVFKDPAAAHEAYKRAASELFAEFARAA